MSRSTTNTGVTKLELVTALSGVYSKLDEENRERKRIEDENKVMRTQLTTLTHAFNDLVSYVRNRDKCKKKTSHSREKEKISKPSTIRDKIVKSTTGTTPNHSIDVNYIKSVMEAANKIDKVTGDSKNIKEVLNAHTSTLKSFENRIDTVASCSAVKSLEERLRVTERLMLKRREEVDKRFSNVIATHGTKYDILKKHGAILKRLEDDLNRVSPSGQVKELELTLLKLKSLYNDDRIVLNKRFNISNSRVTKLETLLHGFKYDINKLKTDSISNPLKYKTHIMPKTHNLVSYLKPAKSSKPPTYLNDFTNVLIDSLLEKSEACNGDDLIENLFDPEKNHELPGDSIF